MIDDLTRHVLGRLPRRLSSRAASDESVFAGPREAERVVAAIADRLGVEPLVIARSLARQQSTGTLERTE